jgi:uncharacterized protein (TIGR03083 family)
MTADAEHGSPRGDSDGADGDTFATQLEVLGASVARLAALVETLDAAQIRQQAYPTEWTVADVLSHLGSGATITRLRLDGDVDMPAVWDEWNAKDPDAQARDAVRADAELQARLAALTPEERSQLRFAMGPMELDLTTFLGMRISEHSLHTWDVAVTFDEAATVPEDEAALVLQTLPMIAGFAGKPTGATRNITVSTESPSGHFAVAVRPDGVSVTPSDAVAPAAPVAGGDPELEMAAESFIRLVYGRLDSDHTPEIEGDENDVQELRVVFPGF